MSDAALLDAIRKRLLETGDWERISRLLRTQLEESGFDDDVKDLAKEKARKAGAPSLGKLVAEVAPAAKGMVSDSVREAVVREIEAVLEREVEKA
ncbi:SAGA histone acetylase and TREX-2 complexes component [Vanrija albida]|uniref:Transcription and mRNA export factor SUS1 n=1 Tax=Vanrija albida TaxID=181172 RepID=A0ABR3Q148_9TREE